jgi:hypothetical protein
MNITQSPLQFYSTGRGGTGNIRSPSRDPSKLDPTEASDEKVVRQHIVEDETVPVRLSLSTYSLHPLMIHCSILPVEAV